MTSYKIVLIALLLCFANIVNAEWTPSVLATELNTPYIESSTFLSNDGLSMYFSRALTDTFSQHRIFQATRETTSGPFTQISQLNLVGSGHKLAPYVSSDNLRMYYQSNSSIPQILLASRASVNDAWGPRGGLNQINAYGKIVSIKFSGDECTAIFTTANSEPWNLYMATRPDKDSSFTSIVPMASTIGNDAADAFLMPDGLSMYFVSSRNAHTYNQLFKATRATLADSFGNVEMIPGFDNVRYPTLSADAKTMYWTKEYWGQNGQLVSDIYVSQFIPEPATLALLGLGGLVMRKKNNK